MQDKCFSFDNMKWIIFLSFTLLQFAQTRALIVPEELPSILSIIYSNIPPIRNGFDTRFGLGFRLGQHADVQLVTEIGPQIETQPLGEPERRRHAPASQYVSSKQKNQKAKQAAVELQHQLPMWTQTDPASAPQPGTWLDTWHKSLVQANLENTDDLELQPKGTTQVDDPVKSHLQKLLKPQP